MAASTSHTLLTPTVIAREGLMQLRNNLVMGSRVHRAYEQEFKKIGGSVTIRKPNKFVVTTARTRSTSTITEASITLTVSTQKHVSWQFNSVDLTLSIEKYSERYITPGAIALSNSIDADVLALYKDINNEVWQTDSTGTGIVTPSLFMTLGKAGQRMDEEAVPQNDRCMVFNPAAHWSMANALSSNYVQPIAEKALAKGYLATIANMDIYMDQNVKVHTDGDFHSTGSTAGLLLGSTGANSLDRSTDAVNTIVRFVDLKIVASEALKAGDVFTIAGCYAVNPISGESTGALRQFVVTTTADNTTVATTVQCQVKFQPDMIHTGPKKTVDTIPAEGAVVNIVGTQGEPFPVNLAFHKNAFALVMVPLIKPADVWGATVSDEGFSIRVIKDYNIDSDEEICRMDVLYGVKTLYPELACRIRGAEG